jgi:hypothetical protein
MKAQELLLRAEKLANEPQVRGRVFLYLGITYAVLGDAEQARARFRAALLESPALTLDPKRIKAEVVEMLEQVRAGILGPLEVTVDLPAATVRVDGRDRGRAPISINLPVGPHEVEVRDTGGKVRFSQRVVVHHGQPTRVEVELLERPTSTPSLSFKPRDEPPRRRLWTWIAASGAAVTALAGAGVWISAAIDHDEFVDGDTRAERGEELRSTIERKQVAIYALFGASGALALTAAVLYYFEGRSASKHGATLSPMLGRGQVGLVLTWCR